jgi:hypothetical protein
MKEDRRPDRTQWVIPVVIRMLGQIIAWAVFEYFRGC